MNQAGKVRAAFVDSDRCCVNDCSALYLSLVKGLYFVRPSSHCYANSRHCLTDALAKYIRERLKKDVLHCFRKQLSASVA